MGTLLVLLVVVAVIAMVCRSMYHDRKKGKIGSCGCDCKKCGGSCH